VSQKWIAEAERKKNAYPRRCEKCGRANGEKRPGDESRAVVRPALVDPKRSDSTVGIFCARCMPKRPSPKAPETLLLFLGRHE